MTEPQAVGLSLEGDWLCAYEDRPDCAATLSILAGSVARNCPSSNLLIASPLDLDAIAPPLPHGTRVLRWKPMVGGWNAKPELLALLLRAGARTACWVDADIFVSGDLRRRMPDDPQILVVAEEVASLPSRDTAEWAIRMGLRVGRRLQRQVNSAVVRASAAHLPLLDAWHRECSSAAYLSEQAKPFDDREDPFKGDQDVLSALLASETFAMLDFFALRSGRDIAHLLGSGGFSLKERLSSLWRGVPVLLHSHGYPKPWLCPPNEWLSVSPYVCAVRSLYKGHPSDVPWTRPATPRAAAVCSVFRDHPALCGVPFLAGGEIRRLIDRLQGARRTE